MLLFDVALYSRLAGDGTGTGKLGTLAPGGVWRRVAPLDTPFPFVIFRQSSPDEDSYTFSGLAYRWLTYEIGVVDKSESGAAAGAALARAEAILQEAEASISVSGWRIAVIRRSSSLDGHFVDQTRALWQTAASIFRIMVVPT